MAKRINRSVTNNIAVHGSVKEAEVVPNPERFGSEPATGA